MATEKLVLIDGHALAYRVFFGLPLEAFSTKSGEPTNATFGFTRHLLDLILDKNPPKYLAVCFDVGRTFRDDWFEDYKGTREKMPDELAVQIERIKEVVSALNIPVFMLDGYEADDLLGTMARQAKLLGVPVHILTGDRDLLQLVDANTTIELPANQWQRDKGPQIFDPAAFVKKYKFQPKQLIDYKALVGDSSDNIPGVAGVGDKTATKLILEYGTLEAIYDNLEAIGTRFRNKLAAGKESAELSYKLAKIVTDAPIELDLAACLTHDFEKGPVLELFHALEFRSLSRRIMREDDHLPSTEEAEDEELAFSPEDFAYEMAGTQVQVIRTAEQLQQLAGQLETAETVAFDLETTGLDEQTDDIVGIALSHEEGTAAYIPISHLTERGQVDAGQMELFNQKERQLAADQLDLEAVLAALAPILTDPKIGKVAHNAKFDYAFLHRFGVTVAPIVLDTMVAEWLCDPGSKFLGLKDLAYHRLKIEMTQIEALIGKGKEQKTFAEVPIEEAAPYAGADADVTLRLARLLRQEIEEKKLERVLAIEMPLVSVLADMERVGIGVDTAVLAEISERLTEQIETITTAVYEIAGHEFNLNSTQQLSDVLFMELDLPHEKLRKLKHKREGGGHYFSTAANVLEDLRPLDETGIVGHMLEYREVQKLKSTYADALPKMVNPQTGRIHTSFNQTGTETGRIASSNPNLQNIPIRSAAGREIRRGFVARPGHLFLAADYSQVELRILAHASQDEALIEAFRQDQDIHATTAAAVYGIPLDEVQFEQRRFAKSVNFGLIYGMGAFRLARDSDLTLSEANEFIETYFEQFPGIRNYLDGYKRQAHNQGYVETLLGRRRYFPVLKERGNRNAKQRAEREAINHPIQGTAADIIKIAMLNLHNALEDGSYRARMILQIHDELMLEVPEAELEAVQQLVVETMREAYQLDVPLKVDAEVGRDWLAVKG